MTIDVRGLTLIDGCFHEWKCVKLGATLKSLLIQCSMLLFTVGIQTGGQ